MNTPDTTQTAHTPTPWRLTEDKRIGPSGNTHACQWWISSDTRKGMALLEVWEINQDPVWRALNGDAISEHAKTMQEVAANAAFIVLAANNHDKLVAALKGMFAVHDDNTGLSGAEQSAILQSARTLLASLQS